MCSSTLPSTFKLIHKFEQIKDLYMASLLHHMTAREQLFTIFPNPTSQLTVAVVVPSKSPIFFNIIK